MIQRILDVFWDRGILLEQERLEEILSSRDPLARAEAVADAMVAGDVIPPTGPLQAKVDEQTQVTPAKRSPVQVAEPSTRERRPVPGVRTLPTPSTKAAVVERPLPDARAPDPAPEVSKPKKVRVTGGRGRLPRDDVAVDLELLRHDTPAPEKGDIDDRARTLEHRFNALARILSRHQLLHDAISIRGVRNASGRVAIIGMLREVTTTKRGHLKLDVEDPTGDLVAICRKGGGFMLVQDEVVGLVGKVNDRGDALFVDEVIHPDVPIRRERITAAEDVALGFISDIHVGSKIFYGKRFAEFIAWLKRGEGVAGKLKYLVIGGDAVDGIGIFPNQEEELAILDVYEQYSLLGQYLEELPDGIEVILLPGNHDPVRLAEPQPPLASTIAKELPDHVHLAPNPVPMQVHGVPILSYHGRSFDDWIPAVPHVTYTDPVAGMIEMMKRRHLAPILGEKNQHMWTGQDMLVIEHVPEIFQTGHVHSYGSQMYRGVRVVNSSTWQAQTSYQKLHNFEPSPGIVPIYTLNDLREHTKEFIGKGERPVL